MVNYSKKTIETEKKEAMPLFIKMAKLMIPMDSAEVNLWIERNIKISGRAYLVVHLQREVWLKMGFVDQSPSGIYLQPEIHLSLIERYKDPKIWEQDEENTTHEKGIFDDIMGPAFPDWLLEQMVNYLQGKPYLESDLETMTSGKVMQTLDQYDNLLKLLAYMMKKPNWHAFMRKFTRLFPDSLYYETVYHPFKLLQNPGEEILTHYFTADPRFVYSENNKIIFAIDSFLAFTRGDIALAKELSAKCPNPLAMTEALMAAYSGDSRAAIEFFNMIFASSPGPNYTQIPSFALFIYTICLKNVIEMDLGEPSKQALKCLKNLQKEFKKSNHPWIELVAAKVQNTPIDREKALPKLIANATGPLPNLLTDIVLRYYYGFEEPANAAIKEAETLVDLSCYRLINMERLHSMPEHLSWYKTIQDSIGVQSPLINGVSQVPKWERLLDELVAQTTVNEKSDTAKVKDQKLARVVYEMWTDGKCSEFSFTPRLQKSKDGITWTSGRNIAIKNFGNTQEGMSDLDMQISRHVKSYSYGWYGAVSFELRGKEVLELLCGHPNVYFGGDNTPIQIFKEGLQITVKRSKSGFVVKANIDISPSIPLFNVVQPESHIFKIIKLTTEQRDLLKALSANLTFPLEAEAKLTKVLGNISRHTTVMSDMLQNAESNAEEIKSNACLTIRMRPVGEGIQADVQVRPLGEKGPSLLPGKGTEIISAVVEGKPLQTKRNLKKEKEHLEAVKPLLYEYTDEADGDFCYTCQSPYSALQLLDALYQMNDHCLLEWPEGEKMRIARRLQPQDLQITVKGASAWFEVDGEIRISEKKVLHMAELLERLRESNGRFVRIGDAEYLALSDQLRKQLALLESMASVQRKKVQLSRYSATAIEGLEEVGVEVQTDKAFTSFMRKVRDAEEVKFTFPKGLKAELRDYQKEGIIWMARLASWGAGACLADDMGLGKTLQAIALMLARKSEGPSLVIVPTSVAMNWKNELNRFAPQLNVLLFNAPGTDREKVIQEAGNNDVVIATYGLLVTEEERLVGKEWNMIVLDEAHTIKNKETKMSLAAMQLQGAFRLLLTGTPLQNHLGELWNLFQFSNPGLLGTNKQFIDKFITPIEKMEDKERMRQLKRIVSPFILRRTKNEVLDELPEKSEVTIDVQLSDEEMAVYENLRREAVLNLENGESTPMKTLAEITRLRQAACNVRLINDKLKISSSKLTTLMSMVSNLISNGHRALVFSQFTSHLALVREALDEAGIEYLYLDGACTAKERERLVKEFQNGTMPLFLISLKAGGTGLNLTAADYVFHLDPWWNPAIEDQASDRTYRIGQTRPVTIYRLIAQQTIEEKILHLHSTKKSLADSLLAGTNASHKLTKDEILQLLK